MADSTQSSQISSSRGFGDSTSGENTASDKGSKFSDSFLSSSPVSLIQSPQDERRAGQGPSSPYEGVSTSLHPCPPPGSSPVAQGSQSLLKGGLVDGVDSYLKDQREGKVETQHTDSGLRDYSVMSMGFSGVTLPSSPFGHNSAQGRTSLDAGNIKTLEGLTEKHESSDTQSGEGFLLFKECHYGSPPIEAHDSSRAFREVASPNQDSPESPFEVLGDSGQGGGLGRYIVDASDHLQTQTLHPTPDVECDVPENTVRERTGPSVPGAFIDSVGRSPELADWGNRPAKPARMEGRSEFEHRVLSSTYTWELDPPGCVGQQVTPEMQLSASPTLPSHSEPSATCLSQTSHVEHDLWICDREEAEIMDADSSGESDDTVIEDTSDRLNLSREFSSSISSLNPKPEDLTESERWPVPTPFSYDTETNKHTLGEEAECDYEFVKEPVRGVPLRSGPKPEVAQITGRDKLMSGSAFEHSERSTSDLRHPQQCSEPPQTDQASPRHQHSEGRSDIAHSDQSSSVAVSSKETMQGVLTSKVLDVDLSREPQSSIFGPDSKDEYSKRFPTNLSSLAEEWKPELMQDRLYTAKCVQQFSDESILSDKGHPSLAAGSFVDDGGTVTKAQPANIAEILSDPHGVEWSTDLGTDFGDTYAPQTFPTAVERGPQTAEDSPETVSDPESIEPECSVSAATDSLVGFMRECLNSRQPKEPEEHDRHHANEEKLPQMAAPFSGSPPAVLLNLEQEHLTICALKELGSSQKEGEDLAQMATTQTSHDPQTSPIAPFAPTPSPPPFNEFSLETPLVREVEGADADEAAQLTAHAMAALLTHLSVRELLYWRDPRKSGVVFGVSLLVLLSLATFSVISVVSYLLLALLCVTITFRVYKSVIQAVQKSGEGHPFKALMEKDLTIPPETFRRYMDLGLSYFNQGLRQMRRLFLVEDLVDSLKLAVTMWLMTYVGAIFNGITILILADILLFTSPPVYEKNKTQIDHYVGIVRTQIETTLAKLQEKLPGAVKRSKVE